MESTFWWCIFEYHSACYRIPCAFYKNNILKLNKFSCSSYTNTLLVMFIIGLTLVVKTQKTGFFCS